MGDSAILVQGGCRLERCEREIPALGEANLLRKPFPGFPDAFHKGLVAPDQSSIALSSATSDSLADALEGDAYSAFQRVVDLYAEAHARLAARDLNRPDIVLMCIPQNVFEKVGTVERKTTDDERKRAKALERTRAKSQLDMFDMLDEVEQPIMIERAKLSALFWTVFKVLATQG